GKLMFTVGEACVEVGRLGEAIRIGGEALAGATTLADAPRRQEKLSAWGRDADQPFLAWARDGYYRSEPGRVVAGYGRARVGTPADCARLLDAMVALCRERQATHVYAELHGQGVAASGAARLAAAKAHALAGELGRALDLIQTVALAYPQAKLESGVHRMLRIAACRPLAEWEATIAERQARGAFRIASLIAR